MSTSKSAGSSIKFEAQIHQIKTLGQGGLLSLFLDQSEVVKLSKFMEYKSSGIIMVVNATPTNRASKEKHGKQEQKNESRKTRRKRRYPYTR